MGSAALPSPVRKIHGALLPLFVSLVVVCYLDRTSLAFAALQLCNSDWFNAKVYGLGSGMFYFSYVLCQIPSNLLLNRLGANTWLPIITAAWGIVAACCVFINGPASFYCLRLALGAAEAGAFPGMWHVCGQFYPHAYITVPYSVIEASIAVSQIAAAPVAAALLQLSGTLGLAGWQWLFLTEGLLTFLLAGVLRLRLPASVTTASFLTEDDKIWLANQLQTPSGSQEVFGSCNVGRDNAPDWGLASKAEKAHRSGELAAAAATDDSSYSRNGVVDACDLDQDVRGSLLLLLPEGIRGSSSNLRHVHQHSDQQSDSACHNSSKVSIVPVTKQQLQQHYRPAEAAASAHSGSSSGSVALTAWQQVRETFSNRLILYLMALKALKDIALDGLVYWVPMLVHALIDGTIVSLSTSGSSSTETKHCGGKDSQLTAVLLSAIPFGTAAAAALIVGHSSELRQERKLHIGLPLLAGGVAFMLLPLLLGLRSHVPAFISVTVAVVAADATTGPFWSWVHMAAKPGTGAVSLAAVNSVGKAGGFLGPLSFGLILHATGSYIPAILLVGAVLMIGGSMALMYVGEKWSRRYEKLAEHELARLEANG